MAKGIARYTSGALVLGGILSLFACSKPNAEQPNGTQTPIPDSFPISNTKFKNCRFQVPNPVYTYGSSIVPNPILCDEGVARSVSLLSANPLPSGLSFSMAQLSLVGTASEKMTSAPYDFYIENEAGYAILKMQITVK